jgi:hypothetical protein
MAKFLWTRRTNFGPAPRSASAMTFDSNRNRVVLFGGDPLTNSLLGDTWIWDGSFWTQMDDIGPAPRRDSAMVYDAARQVAILFGGRTAQAPFHDTWQWDGEDWTQLSDSGPSQRFSHAMAFDTLRNRTVLFGGQSVEGSFLGDTWEFDGVDWTQQEDTGPAARDAHCMAYDATNTRVVLFGGVSGGQALGDTWGWDGTKWVQIAEFGPPVRLAAAMAAMNSNLVLFGGVSAPTNNPPAQVFGDTWEFDGKHWTQRQDLGPGPRRELAMAFDRSHSHVVLFGGLRVPPAERIDSGALLGDTWEHAEVVAVASIAAPATASLGETFNITINLTGPAPSGGAEVTIVLITPRQSVTMGSITIPAGSTTSPPVPLTLPSDVVVGDKVEIRAKTADTPPVSATITAVS